MDKKLFAQLVESMEQMGEISRGERAPSREFHVDAVEVRSIRQATGLSQSKFAKALDVNVGTLRNWEQGLREPTGPARALLRAIKNDPKHVLKALIEPASPDMPAVKRAGTKSAGRAPRPRDRAA
ncbi:helix-turn-helix domain-containing protein [Dyella humi]|uniref:Helix-turn-helix domain-containing protein n=1 Tax=Dyella humi TaxID=1770547 RepID=A0ABW8II85_9GAMM